MIDSFRIIAEKKIRESLDRGELDDLPGRGRPLKLEDDSGVPEDLRMSYKILKNADYLPPELAEGKEIANARDLLTAATDEREKYKAIQKINFMIMKLNERRGRGGALEQCQIYYDAVVEKVTED